MAVSQETQGMSVGEGKERIESVWGQSRTVVRVREGVNGQGGDQRKDWTVLKDLVRSVG